VLTRRRPPVAPLATLGLTALLTASQGCHSSDDDARAASMLRCEAVSSAQVAVSPPTVVVHNGMIEVAGTVHRQAGVTGPLDGRVDIDLIGPDGLRLDRSLHAPLIPNTVPADPTQVARYAPTAFGYVPPAGSVLRARYVDRMQARKENIEDGVLDVNGNGGHTGNDVPMSQENGSMPTSPAGRTN
jgi:hypothetical protein